MALVLCSLLPQQIKSDTTARMLKQAVSLLKRLISNNIILNIGIL